MIIKLMAIGGFSFKQANNVVLIFNSLHFNSVFLLLCYHNSKNLNCIGALSFLRDVDTFLDRFQ